MTAQPRDRAAQLVRVSRRPGASRRRERVRTKAVLAATRSMRSDPQQAGEAQPSGPPRPAQPALGGPLARAAQRARQAVSRRTQAGQPQSRRLSSSPSATSERSPPGGVRRRAAARGDSDGRSHFVRAHWAARRRGASLRRRARVAAAFIEQLWGRPPMVLVRAWACGRHFAVCDRAESSVRSTG